MMDFNNLDTTRELFALNELSVSGAMIPISGFEDQTPPPHLARDFEGNPCMVIPCKDTENSRGEKTKHISIDHETWNVGAYSAQACIVVKCTSKPHEMEFFQILDSLTVDLQSASNWALSPGKIMKKYRELLSNLHERKMSRGLLIGLFAELTLMNRIADHTQAVLDYWRGDERSTHDFICPSASFEVKGTSSPDDLKITISGLKQLSKENTDNKLFLYIARVIPGKSDTSATIDSLIDKLEKKEIPTNELSDSSVYPYLGIDKDKYSDEEFTVSDEYLYLIEEDFPKLTMNDIGELNPELAKRLGEVSYQIDLSGLENFLIKGDDYDEVIMNSLDSE